MILSASSLKKSYIENEIFSKVSFHIHQGDKIGLIGNNGSGKTTLMNLIADKDHADEGEIYYQKDLRVGYLIQHPDFQEDKSIYDVCMEVFEPLVEMEKEIRRLEDQMAKEAEAGNNPTEIMEQYSMLLEKFQERGGYEFPSRVRGMLIGMGFNEEEINRPVREFSGGQKSRILLAKLLLESPDLLLLDEPTNHLDLQTVKFLEDYLKEYRGSILLVSHDRYFIQSICNRIFHLEAGALTVYNMPYQAYRRQREKDIEIIRNTYANQQKEIQRQEEIIRRFANYKSARYVRQAQSRQKMLDRMKKVPPPAGDRFAMGLKFDPVFPSGRDVLAVNNLAMAFDDNLLFHNVDFDIYRGEKVGLIGENGIGKTTIFRMIRGQLRPVEGSVTLGTSVETAYFDQEQKDLNLDNTVMDELWNAYPKLNHYELRSYLAKFQFFGDDLFRFVGELSGGERARLSLLKLMLSKSNFLLLDEPTNHLDIDSREVLEEACRDYGGTVFFISHDRYFLNQVAERILLLTSDGIMEFKGNYDYFVQKMQEMRAPEKEEPISKTLQEKEKRRELEKQRENKKKRQAMEDVEASIHEMEQRKEEIHQILATKEIYEDLDRMQKLAQELELLDEKIEEAYEDWMNIQ